MMLSALPHHNDKILRPAFAFGLNNAPMSDRVQSYESLFIRRTDAAVRISRVPLLLSFKGYDRRLQYRQPNSVRSPRAWRGCWDPGGAFEHNVVLFGRGHRLVTGHVNNAAIAMTVECWSKRVAEDRSLAPWMRGSEKPSEGDCVCGNRRITLHNEMHDGGKKNICKYT